MKMMTLTDEIISEHYDFWLEKDFSKNLKLYVNSEPIIAMAITGTDVIKTVHALMNTTNSVEGMKDNLVLSIGENLLHASKNGETATMELKRFFTDEEPIEYENVSDSGIKAEFQ